MPFESSHGARESILPEVQKLVDSVNKKESKGISKFQKLSENFYDSFVAREMAKEKVFGRSEEKKADTEFKKLQADVFSSKPTKEEVRYLQDSFVSVRDQHTKMEQQLDTLKDNNLGDRNMIKQMEQYVKELGWELLAIAEQLDLLNEPRLPQKAESKKEEKISVKNDINIAGENPPRNVERNYEHEVITEHKPTRRSERGGGVNERGGGVKKDTSDIFVRPTFGDVSNVVGHGSVPDAELSFDYDDETISDGSKTLAREKRVDEEKTTGGKLVAGFFDSYNGIEDIIQDWRLDAEKSADPKETLPKLKTIIDKLMLLDGDMVRNFYYRSILSDEEKEVVTSLRSKLDKKVETIGKIYRDIELHGDISFIDKINDGDEISEVSKPSIEKSGAILDFGPPKINESFTEIVTAQKRFMKRFKEMEKLRDKSRGIKDDKQLLQDLNLILRGLSLMNKKGTEDLAVFGHKLTYNQSGAVHEVLNELDNNQFIVSEAIRRQTEIIQEKTAIKFDSELDEPRPDVHEPRPDVHDDDIEFNFDQSNSNGEDSDIKITKDYRVKKEKSEKEKAKAEEMVADILFKYKLNSDSIYGFIGEMSKNIDDKNNIPRLDIAFSQMKLLRDDAEESSKLDIFSDAQKNELNKVVMESSNMMTQISKFINDVEKGQKTVSVTKFKKPKQLQYPPVRLYEIERLGGAVVKQAGVLRKQGEVAKAIGSIEYSSEKKEVDKLLSLFNDKIAVAIKDFVQIEKDFKDVGTVKKEKEHVIAIENSWSDLAKLRNELSSIYVVNRHKMSYNQTRNMEDMFHSLDEFMKEASHRIDEKNKIVQQRELIEGNTELNESNAETEEVMEYEQEVREVLGVVHGIFTRLRDNRNIDSAKEAVDSFEAEWKTTMDLSERIEEQVLFKKGHNLSEGNRDRMWHLVDTLDAIDYDIMYGIKEADKILDISNKVETDNLIYEGVTNSDKPDSKLEDGKADNVIDLKRKVPKDYDVGDLKKRQVA